MKEPRVKTSLRTRYVTPAIFGSHSYPRTPARLRPRAKEREIEERIREQEIKKTHETARRGAQGVAEEGGRRSAGPIDISIRSLLFVLRPATAITLVVADISPLILPAVVPALTA